MSGNLQACAVELEALFPETPEGAQAAPDIFGLIAQVRSLIAAVKSGDYMAILQAVYDIIGQFVKPAAPATDSGVAFAPGGIRAKLLAIVAKILAELAAG